MKVVAREHPGRGGRNKKTVKDVPPIKDLEAPEEAIVPVAIAAASAPNPKAPVAVPNPKAKAKAAAMLQFTCKNCDSFCIKDLNWRNGAFLETPMCGMHSI